MPKQNLPGVVDIIRDLRQALPYCFHALSRILGLSKAQPAEKSHIAYLILIKQKHSSLQNWSVPAFLLFIIVILQLIHRAGYR